MPPRISTSARPSAESQLGADLRAAFVAPFRSRRWRSIRARRTWCDLEYWQDAMAGPLDCIARTGGCSYVYTRNDRYFSAVDTPEALLGRLLTWHGELSRRVRSFRANTPSQRLDVAYMLAVVEQMRAVVDRGYEIVLARWHRERQVASSSD